MSTGAWVVVAAVAAALAFGSYRFLTDGRFRGTHRLPLVEPTEESPPSVEQAEGSPSLVEQAEGSPSLVEQRRPAGGLSVSKPHKPSADVWSHVQTAIPEATLGEKATLLQFSSAFCAPCRATRRTLSEVAAVVPGVEHLEVDAEHHLELVRALKVLRTPTTIVLDATGREITRAAGAPRKEQVIAALGSA